MSRFVVAYHLIITTYGFWLPNDPRGSWSDFVRSWEIFVAGGPATRVYGKRSYARDPHDHEKRRKTKEALVRPEVRFSGLQARASARGFARFVEKSGITVHACSILPQHVHMVIARHRYAIEQIANLMKGAATNQLIAENLHPFQDDRYENGRMRSCWGRGHWSVFLGEGDVERAIRYVRNNPLRDRRKAQRWSFISDLVA